MNLFPDRDASCCISASRLLLSSRLHVRSTASCAIPSLNRTGIITPSEGSWLPYPVNTWITQEITLSRSQGACSSFWISCHRISGSTLPEQKSIPAENTTAASDISADAYDAAAQAVPEDAVVPENSGIRESALEVAEVIAVAAQDAVRTSEGYDEIAAQTADEPGVSSDKATDESEEASDKAVDITEGE